MENKRPRGREKKVVEGSSSVYKREEAKTGSGPVSGSSGRPGSKPSESQRPEQTSQNRPGPKRAGALGSIGTIIVVLVLIRLLAGSCNANTQSSSVNVPSQPTQYVVSQPVQTTAPTEAPAPAVDMTEILQSMLAGTPAASALNTAVTNNTVNNTPVSATQSVLTGVTEEKPAQAAVSGEARQKYTKIKGNGKDVYTIMVYMCGTDLESNYGMATNDLNEMLKAKVADNINLIVETGGCKTWQNSVMSNRTNQRYKITSKGLVALDQNVGKKAMTDAATLKDFIEFCKTNFPANRNALILWDHGGGSLSGYGHDQLYISKGSMPLDQLHKALKDADMKFDFIGFDACLMGTLETAVATEPFADYLIGSEETEPGVGWYYTDWLSVLSRNTSMPTVEIGKRIIDDFTTVCARSTSDATTLSIVDLAEFSGTVPKALSEFSKSISSLVDSNNYKTIANARANTREFSRQNRLNQIDLIDFANRIGTQEAYALANALSGAIKYNRTSRSMTNANGISTYFPNQSNSGVSSMLSINNSIGMSTDYSDAIKNYASLQTGGQIIPSSFGYGGTGSLLESLLGSYGGYSTPSTGSTSWSGGTSYGGDMAGLLNAFLGGGDFSSIYGARSMDWVNTDLISRNAERIAANMIQPERIVLTEKNGEKVLALTEEEWACIEDVALNVFYDDGEGYIDLGIDNVFDFNADGDLIASFDGTWLSLNRQIVPYYWIETIDEGDAYMIKGYIPAMLNKGTDGEQQVEIMLQFDDQNPYGYITGARIHYSEDVTGTLAKGLIALKEGDTLDFLCDYYDKQGNYQANYYFGEQFVVNGPIEIANIAIENNRSVANYQLTDIYGNSFWTPTF